MTIRRSARWQHCVDERILEHLRDESWATPRFMANLEAIHATEAQVRDRCRVLADADLVAFLTEDQDFVEITSKGRRYLEGGVDLELYPYPRHPRAME